MAVGMCPRVAKGFQNGVPRQIKGKPNNADFQYRTDGKSVFLYGHEVVRRDSTGKVFVSNAGYPTTTTHSVIRQCVPECRVCIRRGQASIALKGKWVPMVDNVWYRVK